MWCCTSAGKPLNVSAFSSLLVLLRRGLMGMEVAPVWLLLRRGTSVEGRLNSAGEF